MKILRCIVPAMCGLFFCAFAASAENGLSATNTLLAIARDIEGLKSSYPQLKAFSVTNHVDLPQLRVTYEFTTHAPLRQGGWTSGVPNPNRDGIWFFLDFHDPRSDAQIHTQPITSEAYFGDKAVSFLILEGAETRSIQGAVWKILMAHGVTTNKPALH